MVRCAGLRRPPFDFGDLYQACQLSEHFRDLGEKRRRPGDTAKPATGQILSTRKVQATSRRYQMGVGIHGQYLCGGLMSSHSGAEFQVEYRGKEGIPLFPRFPVQRERLGTVAASRGGITEMLDYARGKSPGELVAVHDQDLTSPPVVYLCAVIHGKTRRKVDEDTLLDITSMRQVLSSHLNNFYKS